MARADRPDSGARHLCATEATRVHRTAVPLAALVLAVFTLVLALLPAQPASAQEVRWVLTQTRVNPEKLPLEYYGGGKTPGFFEEERFKDMFLIYIVSAANFTVKDHWQDRDYVSWNVTVSCDFEAPKQILIPGDPYQLRAGFSHVGTATDPHPGEAFTYYSPDFSLDPNESLVYSPSAPGWEDSSMTWTFTAPAASPGAAMEIQAGLWNAPACTVIWKYEARTVAFDTTTTTVRPSTSTSAPVATTNTSATGSGDTDMPQPPTFTEEEFEKMKADAAELARWYDPSPHTAELMRQGYIGIVIAEMGDLEIYDYSGYSKPTSRGQLIRMGDTIRTGSNGMVRVQMFDRDDARDTGPSVINVGTASRLVFTSSGKTAPTTLLDMIAGMLRWVHWGRGEAKLSIRTGVTICGSRGTDVLVGYDPNTEIAAFSVREGPVDVTGTRTGSTDSLADYQNAVVRDGEVGEVLAFVQQDWDEMMESTGLGGDMQPLSAQELEELLAQTGATTGATGGQRPSNFTQAETERMLADVAAFADSRVSRGRLYETDLLKQGYVGLLGSASGELSVYDHAGQEVDLSVPRLEAENGNYLLPIRIGDTIRTGSGEGIVHIFTRYSSEKLVLEIRSNAEVVFTSAGNAINDVSATLLGVVRGMIRTRYTAESSSDVFSLEVGANLLRAGQGSDVVISYDPGEDSAGLWVREGSMDVTSSRTGETEYLGDDWGLVMEDGEFGAFLPLEDDLWDDITVGGGMDDVKPWKVVAVEQSDRPGGRPLALVEFEESNRSLILAVVLPVVVAAAAAGVGVLLLRRRRRRTGEVAAPSGAGAVSSPSFCRHCGSPVRPGSLSCEKCEKKLAD